MPYVGILYFQFDKPVKSANLSTGLERVNDCKKKYTNDTDKVIIQNIINISVTVEIKIQ